MLGRRVTLVVILLLVPAMSGCLAHDIWREPFRWQEKAEVGENIDGAQAFAGALGDLGSRGNDTAGKVVEDVDDLPNNAVFQNMRDFLNRQSPGRGDQVHDNVTTATGAARDAYVTLAGPAAAALAEATGPLAGTEGKVPIEVAQRSTRVRLALDIVLIQQPDEEGTNPTPVGNLHIKIWDPRGGLRVDKTFDVSRQYQDMFVVGTWGDDNEVRRDLGGSWQIEVQASGEGAWALGLEGYEPRYDDYKWYQFWRGEARKVVGE